MLGLGRLARCCGARSRMDSRPAQYRRQFQGFQQRPVSLVPPPLKEEIVMARAVFPHEITDPDFQWLLNSYCEAHPAACRVETGCLPIVIILSDEKAMVAEPHPDGAELVAIPPVEPPEPDSSSQKK